MKILYLLLTLVCIASFGHVDASAGQISHTGVGYTGVGSSAGLNATAEFERIAPKHLRITLNNTSVTPFGTVDGKSAMVLSSLSFDLGDDITITSGSVALSSGSYVVETKGGVWGVSSWSNDLNNDLNDEYAYSNTGVGNNALSGAALSNITATQVASLNNSVTSHSNGGQALTRFGGGSGLPGGLDFGLVVLKSSAFGNSNFINSSIVIDLMLSQKISDLQFLTSGSYVEFGSDNVFTGGAIIGGGPPPPPNAVPEPGALAIWMLMGIGGVARRRSRSKRA